MAKVIPGRENEHADQKKDNAADLKHGKKSPGIWRLSLTAGA
jgi:hypothetical protein